MRGRGETKSVSADQHAHEELVHIGRMIAELARVATSERRAPMRHPVMRPEYWGRRIDALISTTADEPLRRDAAALRKRLAGVFSALEEPITGNGGELARETCSRK
jgi:hypothetical protein